ncbi:hypothetical protein L204_101611 [Cryptococcus depauperatus]|nr:hypothetical protein L204_04424 [Cryptococcus depauperatus CBS 7855]
MSLFSVMSWAEDFYTIPYRVFNNVSKGQAGMEELLPIAFRAIMTAATLALLRRVWLYVGDWLLRVMFPVAFISSADPAYHWIATWIAQDRYAQRQIHDFELITSEAKSVVRKGRHIQANALYNPHQDVMRWTYGADYPTEENMTWKGGDIVGLVMPMYGQSIRIKHNGNYIWITRKALSYANGAPSGHFRVRTFAFRPHILRGFLVAAHGAFYAKEDHEILIFHANMANEEDYHRRISPTWQKPVSRAARPWSSVILPPNVKEGILKDMEKFLSDKEIKWYSSKGIPHRRGYIFYGKPGMGKSTLVYALASKLGLDIYILSPSQRGMDDATLSKLLRDCPAKAIILIEDIDRIFAPRGRDITMMAFEVETDAAARSDDIMNVDAEAELLSPNVTRTIATSGQHDLAPSTVTMSGLLNAIDGVSSQEGCVLVATTNHIEHLDPALSRPGRFDVQIAFHPVTIYQARELYLHFYPLHDFGPNSFSDNDISLNEVNEKMAIVQDQVQLDKLADRFVDAIFPSNDEKKQASRNSISMAALQGYLIRYKDDPFGAIENAQQWADTFEREQVVRVAKRSHKM